MSRALALALLCTAASTFAQTITSSIVGTVSDTSNAPVAGAAVTLTQTATQAHRVARTDVRGDFVFSSLQPGEYSLLIEAAGFKRIEKRGIQLSAAESLPAGEFVLEVGSLTESVTVVAQGATVQTASAERSGVLTGSQVEGLLIRSRSVMLLLQLLPGVADMQDPDRVQPDWALHVQGNRRGANWLQLDGMMINGAANNTLSTVNVSMDAIQEVKILLTNY